MEKKVYHKNITRYLEVTSSYFGNNPGPLNRVQLQEFSAEGLVNIYKKSELYVPKAFENFMLEFI